MHSCRIAVALFAASQLVGQAACDSPSDDVSVVTSLEGGEQIVAPKPAPPPVAEVTTTGGTTVGFYEIDGRGLITESGKAPTNPALPTLDRTGKSLADIFAALRPDLEVPESLVALDTRLREREELAAKAPTPELEPSPPRRIELDQAATVGTSSPHVGESVPSKVLIGCTNGCCDPDWTHDQLCHPLPCGTGSTILCFYHFNTTWSYYTAGGMLSIRHVVCAAIGASNQYVNNSYWHVNEGFYHTWEWASWTHCPWYSPSCRFSGEWRSNYPEDPHTHTACGTFYW